MVIIQLIFVRWTAKSRGAPEANLRNAVTKSLPIQPDQSGFLFEKFNFDERNGFAQTEPSRLVKDRMPEEIDNLFLEIQNEDLIVGFHYNLSDIGKPVRHDKSHALRLHSGQYGRLVVNGRHTSVIEEYPNWYSQHIYNIALVEQPTSDWFTSRKPDQICDLQADLF